jgi:hypothetical protein
MARPHQRFIFYFAPISWSWLNTVEGFFAKLAKRRLKRGIFRSVVDLKADKHPTDAHGTLPGGAKGTTVSLLVFLVWTTTRRTRHDFCAAPLQTLPATKTSTKRKD